MPEPWRTRATSAPPLQNPERFCHSTGFCVDAALIQELILITLLEIFRMRRKETTLDKFAFASSCDVSVFHSGCFSGQNCELWIESPTWILKHQAG